MVAKIQFSRGIDEDAIPDVRLTRSRDGSQGTAKFYFLNPKALADDATEDITGMYMIDDDGEIVTREVNAKFINGKPTEIEAIHLMKSPEEWERFMLFMERYAQAKGLEFSKS
ncbi:photosystem II reaction center protein Psb28 [Planktothrix paucivesiculata]|uniref:Photosystem II reaction center Psb28 protein n=1 Tax=Planktothrix paucivesiculata PCC 9631 TaxID=671071 RepID=A0A7Z9BR44_9CYAN|nr:photosystem II reaction center protein Psb28 [Planktothrix paucivesiculata]VXD20649.1 Photosystem II reaction center Psb28 protein [Planktothrix paucivesiculata PCC 9631]